MAQGELVNLNSLQLVSDELVITIEQAAGKLEQFVLNQGDEEALASCIAAIEQITGTLKLIQLPGGEALATEILEATRSIQKTGSPSDSLLNVITGAFFILPRYLEYVQQTRRALPVLLIPYINSIREELQQPLMPDSAFFSINSDSARRQANSNQVSELPDNFIDLVKRLRHMYQVGLLNVLQGKQPKNALMIMQRALLRIDALCCDREFSLLTWAGSNALAVMQQDSMDVTKNRKLLLSSIDRSLKQLQVRGSEALDQKPNPALLTGLVYIIALAKEPTDHAREVLQAFGTAPLEYSEDLLRKESESMRGPSANTVSSMAAVLKDELRSTKEILENASQMGQDGIADYDELIQTLTKVADILSVVGLVSASNTLKEELVKIEHWKASNEPTDARELIEVADALLYVESTISGLEKLNLSDEELNMANSLARREVIASTQLAEAELLVIQEAESGLALIKRALSSYSESNYDSAHIQNVTSTLNSVRGGLIVLNLNRAAAVVAGCVDFVEQTLIDGNHAVAMQQLLETFADAIIGLEYYLDSLRMDLEADDSVLTIAENSLEALGYKVEGADQ
ncbi:MAG: type IV pilus/biofilm regulator FimL [Candidatus Pelagadaptatus aseana]|uniref:pilus assembly protein n=1 Tax=Candidatus Pelagadaptatus aseana TaxID=3120508 RepID=UPI0039B1F1A7